ncbi:MAG: zinc-ribbon domain-containing protein [Sandaracinus sp.]|nr:zinc-ribbon domain-containing protein [Sandaracinus sp.]
MKIVCDNCGAKYSIADEKVAGKVFKIRCKKCTHVIVVRGDQGAADDGATAAGFDYGGEAVWHVVVDGDQQGPFSPQQLGEMMTAGQIDWEAYVWKEGFDGWKPARDIPELVTAISGEEASPEASGEGAAFGADPFAGGGAAFAAAAPEAARASADAGADLFAQSDPASSPFGGGAEDDGVVASAPSPRVSQEQASMTGQRNENSVLFSLSNLQALATGGPSGAPAPSASGPSPSAPAPKAGHATGEGSGLIDIRALASATAAPSGGSAPSGGGGVPDDLLSIGGGSGGLGSSLGAPVLAPAAPEPEKNNKGLIVGLSIAGVAVVGLLVALVVILSKDPEPVAAVAGAAPQAAGGELANPNAAAPAVPAAAGVAPAVPAVPAAAGVAPTAMAEEPAAEEPEEDRPRGSTSTRRDRDRGSSSAMEAAPARATSMADAPAASPMSSSMGNIDDLLDRALGGGSSMSSAMAEAPAAMSNLPEQPGRDDVARGLRSISSSVEACGGGTSGVANAAITFASTGRVSSVNVTGVPPAVQSCVARTVRGARVPPFSRPTFNVNFPFRVR